MARRQRALPRDLGLELRMGFAMLLSALLLGAAAAGLVWLAIAVDDGWKMSLLILLTIAAGAGVTKRSYLPARGIRQPASEDEARVRAHIDRLAMLAGIAPPRCEVVRARAPLSWTTALRPSRAKVRVSVSLLDRLDEDQLEAVIAHEIAHLVHRDAIVMTVLAGPPSLLIAALRDMASEGIRELFGAIVVGLFLLPPAALMLAVSRTLSRYREFAADRTAALLTGSPGAVAAALVALDDQLAGMRRKDLRRVAALDAFHFLPAREPRWLGRLWATHPRMTRRLRRLERLEAAVQRHGAPAELPAA